MYRLPLTMFERGLPKLIGEGLLTTNEISGLVEYIMRAEELNRGLDRGGEPDLVDTVGGAAFFVSVEIYRCVGAVKLLYGARLAMFQKSQSRTIVESEP